MNAFVGFEVNTLTVVANEGYEQFAENLQKEIEADTGIRFGIVEKHQFASHPRNGRGRPDNSAWESRSLKQSGRTSKRLGMSM